jgi:hypothetical protein
MIKNCLKESTSNVSTHEFVIVLGRITLRKSETQHIYPFDCPHFVVPDKFCQLRKIIIQVLWKKIHITQTQRQIKWIFHGSSKV